MEKIAPFVLDPRLVFPESALGRLPQGMPPDHLLKASVQNDDIVLQLEYPLSYPQDPGTVSDVLQLLVNGTLVGDEIDLGSYGPGDTLNVPLRAADRPVNANVDRLPAIINYIVTHRVGGNTELGPSDQGFVTDIVRPGRDGLGPLVFDPDVVANGVTPDALVDDGSGNLYLPATVKTYAEVAAGDWIAGLIDSDADLLAPIVEITAGQVGSDIELRFPLPLLESAGDGTHQFTYIVEDRAGLRSVEATHVSLEIRLKAAPVITSVSGAEGEVANGGTTVDTDLTVSGTAEAGEFVELFDGDTPLGTARVEASGQWSREVNGLAVGPHRFKAVGLYGSQPQSGAWTLTVKQRLTIDTSVLTLAGALVRHSRTPTVPPSGTTATRTASGGTPPYTYSASTNAVDINPSTGNVVSFRNGQATVTVRDAAGQTAAYTVDVSNVLELDGWSGYNTYRISLQLAYEQGGRIPTQYEWLAYAAAYGGAPQLPPAEGDMEAWSTTSAGGNLLYTFVPNTGVQGNQPDQNWVGGGRGGAVGWAVFTRQAG